MPSSTAVRMIRMASFSSTFLSPRCQPPRPIAETRSPVLPSMRKGMSVGMVAKSVVRSWRAIWVFTTLLGAGGCRPGRPRDASPEAGLQKLDHIVVIYLENRSFDNLYGEFSGAEGLSSAGASFHPQVDSTNAPYVTLPAIPSDRFPAGLPNAPFNIEQYLPANVATIDLVHRFYQEQLQIDHGRMDRFAQVSDAKGLVMGYYHTGGLPLAAEARRYTVADHFFHAAFGGSFLNHIWLIAARTPVFPAAPVSVVAKVDSGGGIITDGFVTPDGYVVNT